MSGTFRRFEILLPLRFNDGQPVPNELIGMTLLELEQRFCAVSSETQAIQGFWQHQGQTYRDDLPGFSLMFQTRRRALNFSGNSKKRSRNDSSKSTFG
ncbi:MAG: hypothetical protein JWN40_4464 [Phycisphaerales bacterium]|nr:hypothetical protein [Phycisphaerales bacterium]